MLFTVIVPNTRCFAVNMVARRTWVPGNSFRAHIACSPIYNISEPIKLFIEVLSTSSSLGF